MKTSIKNIFHSTAKLTVGVALVCSVSSCSDWLDVKSDMVEREKDIFTSYAGYQSALAGCYTSMGNRSIYGEKLTMNDIEQLACLWSEPNRSNYETLYNLYHHDYDNDEVRDVVEAVYGGLYNVVVQANMIINNIDNDGVIQDPQARAVVKAEAYAIRAFCHFDVLRLFGQVPNNAQKKISLPYAEKGSISELPAYYDYDSFVKKIEGDLKVAEDLLKDNDPIMEYSYGQLNQNDINPADLEDDFLEYRRFRMNYWAVRALKARMYLYIGDTAKAYTEAMAVINATLNDEKVVELSGVSDTNFGYFALPSECLFALSQSKLIDYSISVLGGSRTDQVRDGQLHVTNNMLNQLFADQGTGSNNRYLQVWNKDAANNQGIKMPTIRKYYYDANNYTSSNSVSILRTQLQLIPMLRLSEIYLIAMETTTNLTEANTLYKEYMVSHNVNVTTDFASLDDVRAEMVNEYRREFYGEGVMFYVYKRMGTKNMQFNLREDMSEELYALPLPESEFDPNANNK